MLALFAVTLETEAPVGEAHDVAAEVVNVEAVVKALDNPFEQTVCTW
jgi:hypothetical protein